MESFVDRAHFTGASYQAANWIRVGRTQGRGRQDRFRQASETVKDIYVYPLEKDFRAQWGLAADAGRSALGPANGLEAETWSEKEFGGAPLGDERLSKRLVKVASAKGDSPERAFCGVVQGDGAAVKGYYRLIDMPEDSAVTMDNILQPHRDRTVRRMQGQHTVLCLQDGSDLDYNSLAACTGLGEIGANQTGAKSRGLHLHTKRLKPPLLLGEAVRLVAKIGGENGSIDLDGRPGLCRSLSGAFRRGQVLRTGCGWST
jgi:hypothetical protein